MASPAQMFDSYLDVNHGYHLGQPWTVNKAVNLASTVVLANAKAGRVVSLSTSIGGTANGTDPSTRRWIMGSGTTAYNSAPMPFLLVQGAADYDVVGDDYNLVGATAASSDNGYGRPTAICVAGGSEVESTEFDTGITDWAPGDLCVGTVTTGIITRATAGAARTIMGVVTDGCIKSPHKQFGKYTLRFITCYVPRWLAATLV